MHLPIFNNNRKTAVFLALFVITAAVFVLLPTIASAQVSLGLGAAEPTGLGTVDLKILITNIVRIILGFLGIISVVIILYGGYIWMTSQGNEDKISQAKKILVNAVIGLAIILSAFAIVSFILNRLQEITREGEGLPTRDRGGFDIGIGTLGGGILRDVYPEPGARDVPRNTLIMVTFKEEMAVGTLIDTATRGDACPEAPDEVTCGFLKEINDVPTVRIINRTDDFILAASQAVAMTNDNKSFVFNPVQYLGSPDGYTHYSVNLTDQIDKADGSPAFLVGGYTWSFEVSNVADLTPPSVTDVIPVMSQEVYMNAILQINFNEAVNVISATGVSEVDGDGQLIENSFRNINLRYDDAEGQIRFLSGEFSISNRFRTVEFIPDNPCPMPQGMETNSCGQVPYCLPSDVNLTSLIKAALTQPAVNIFSGITDAAANSLDGGGQGGASANGQANGRPADDQDQFNQEVPNDNYWWNFSTNDQLDLTPPEIININPEHASPAVPKNSRIRAEFDEYIRSSTLSSESYTIFESACAEGAEFPADPNCYPQGGFRVYKENANNQTTAVLRTYYPYLNPLTEYNPRLTAEIQDLYQNCFNPAVGPCAEGQISPYCE